MKWERKHISMQAWSFLPTKALQKLGNHNNCGCKWAKKRCLILWWTGTTCHLKNIMHTVYIHVGAPVSAHLCLLPLFFILLDWGVWTGCRSDKWCWSLVWTANQRRKKSWNQGKKKSSDWKWKKKAKRKPPLLNHALSCGFILSFPKSRTWIKHCILYPHSLVHLILWELSGFPEDHLILWAHWHLHFTISKSNNSAGWTLWSMTDHQRAFLHCSWRSMNSSSISRPFPQCLPIVAMWLSLDIPAPILPHF